VLWETRILSDRRAIDPHAGHWTLPAGYVALDQSTPAGALREVREEAQAGKAIDGLCADYDIPRISAVSSSIAPASCRRRSRRGRKAARSGCSAGTRSRGPISPSRR